MWDILHVSRFRHMPMHSFLLLLLHFLKQLLHDLSSISRQQDIFTKTPMFSTKYSPGLKDILFSNRIYKYKEIASLLTLFTEHRLDSDNSNFVFNRIYRILISLEAGQITHYDDLFCELFLHRYRTQVKKKVMFLTNITKVRLFPLFLIKMSHISYKTPY